MANEFIARNGLISQNNTTVTGSLTVTNGITGSLFGTSSWAVSSSRAVSSSFASTAATATSATTATSVSSIAGNVDNNGNDYILTATGGGSINGESALTFNGNTLNLSGNLINGNSPTAGGSYSHAEGLNTQAFGDYSHAEGDTTKTGTENTFRAGDDVSITSGVVTLNSAYGDVSSIFGAGNLLLFSDLEFDNVYGTVTFLIDSVVWNGTYTVITLVDTTINTTKANCGDLTYITSWAGSGGDRSIYAHSSHTEGSITTTFGTTSHAEGSGSFAVAKGSHAEGYLTIAGANYSHAEGQQTQALGAYSHAEGVTTKAKGEGSHAEGRDSIASGSYSHAEGSSTVASGNFSHAEGWNTRATNTYAHAEGRDTIASGFASHAQGRESQAIGNFSHAEGSSITNGSYSHAEGASTTAQGDYSHAEGIGSISAGEYSHAEGNYTIADGIAAHAAGYYTSASGDYQSVIGAYNIASTTPSAFIVGNGSGEGSRSNLIFAAGTNVQVTGSLNVTQGITGSLFGTASFAISSSRSVSSSYALTSSYSNTSTSASFAVSSSRAVSSSYAVTSSYSNTSTSASFSTSASLAANATNATLATTASRVDINDAGTTAGAYKVLFAAAQSGTQRVWANTSLEYNPNTNLLSTNIEGNANTANSATTATSASYARTASVAPAYLPLTGGTISGNLTVVGTASFAYSTASIVQVGSSIITLNTNNPATRFGGISVVDSGSFGTSSTGSLFWDSQNNRWIYSNPSGSTYDGGMLISGPRNTSGLGNETGMDANFIAVGQGTDHIRPGSIYNSGSGDTAITQISGSLVVVNSATSAGINTSTAQLYDFSGITSIAYNTRTAYDTVGDESIDWNNRVLSNQNGTILDWSVGYLEGTASYATQALSASWAPAGGLTGGTTNYVPLWTSTTALSSSAIYQSTGNVGIGTSNPQNKFAVSDGGNLGVEINPSYLGESFITTYNRGTSAYGTLNLEASNLSFRTGTSPTVKATITSTGQIGLGTASPTAPITISGSTELTGSFKVKGDTFKSGSLFVTSSAATLGQFVGNQNGYVEFSVRNTNTGISASGDIAIYADNGTISNNYIDMGINNSGMNSTYSYFGTDFGNALDAYLYNVGGNLRIGNATSAAPYSQSLLLFSNPTATPNIWITGSQVAIGKNIGTPINGNLDITGSTVISGSLRGQVNALSIASNTASINLAANNFHTVTLVNGANTHISASNIQPGQTVNVRVTQGSAGTGTMTFNTAIKSGSLYTGSAVANAVDIITFISFDSSTLYMSAVTNLK